MLHELENENLEKELNRFLDKIVPVKYPEVNHIIVQGELWRAPGNFYYTININPTFAGSKRLQDDPKFENELFGYIFKTSDFALKMFKQRNTGHYTTEVRWFWD